MIMKEYGLASDSGSRARCEEFEWKFTKPRCENEHADPLVWGGLDEGGLGRRTLGVMLTSVPKAPDHLPHKHTSTVPREREPILFPGGKKAS